MTRAGCPFVLFCLISTIAFFFSNLPVRAKDTEYREFSVFVDGKDAGTSKMTIVQNDDGSTYMSASLDVKFRRIIGDYALKIDTQEWWKDGRLVGMQTESAENAKKTSLLVALKDDQLRIRVNGQERLLKSEIWTNSFWKLADPRFHNKQVPVLEVDTGKEFNCDLKFLGQKQLKVGNELQDCYHFRVSGTPAVVELWFDRYHRLVRQESTELGYKIIVQLNNARR